MKVIDLLNKIANGEKIPKKIKCMNRDYIYSKRTDEDFNYINPKTNEYFSEEWYMENILNDEVMILEDTTEIEEYQTKYTERCIDVEVREKLNEVIKAVNVIMKFLPIENDKDINCMTD